MNSRTGSRGGGGILFGIRFRCRQKSGFPDRQGPNPCRETAGNLPPLIPSLQPGERLRPARLTFALGASAQSRRPPFALRPHPIHEAKPSRLWIQGIRMREGTRYRRLHPFHAFIYAFTDGFGRLHKSGRCRFGKRRAAKFLPTHFRFGNAQWVARRKI